MTRLLSFLMPIVARVVGEDQLSASAMLAERCVARARLSSKAIVATKRVCPLWRDCSLIVADIDRMRDERRTWMAEARKWLDAAFPKEPSTW